MKTQFELSRLGAASVSNRTSLHPACLFFSSRRRAQVVMARPGMMIGRRCCPFVNKLRYSECRYLPYIGYATLLLNDHTYKKYGLIGALAQSLPCRIPCDNMNNIEQQHRTHILTFSSHLQWRQLIRLRIRLVSVATHHVSARRHFLKFKAESRLAFSCRRFGAIRHHIQGVTAGAMSCEDSSLWP